MGAAFVYIWMYDVREGCEQDFETLYGPDGGWAQLFRKSGEYLGTDLLCDQGVNGRYVTVDRWTTSESHREFVSAHREEFAALDCKGEELTRKESRIGDFDVVRSEG